MRVYAPRFFASLIPQVLALLLVGCGGDDGGGGGGGNPFPPPITTDTTPPTVPAGVTAVAQSETSILVSWTASTDVGAGVAGYRIFRDGGATAIATVTVPAISFTDTNLTAGTNYSYTVRAFDAAVPVNESALSGAVSATTPVVPIVDTTPPSVPTNLTANALSQTSVRLNWTASTDVGTGVAGYRVYRNGAATPIATVTGAVTYMDSGLTANTTYSYTLRAFDAATPANDSGLSLAVNITTLAVPDTTPPTAPTGLAATVLSSTQIRLNWTASTDAAGIAGYRVFRNGTGSGTALTTVTGTTFTDSGLTPSTSYTYTVRAVDGSPAANASPPSNAVTATTQATDITAPTVPANVTATALSTTQIRINWTASTDAGAGISGYRVFRNGTGAGTALTTVTGTTFTDSGLTASTSYTYSVRAVDAATPTANVSAASAPATATTLAAPDVTAPTVPGGVTATALSSSQIRVDWSASTDAGTGVAGYRIFRDGSTTVLATVTSGTTYTDSALAAGTNYSYALRAYDNASPANVSALSTAANATTQGSPNPSGLDTRPSNTTCLAGAAPSQNSTFTIQHVYTQLSFADPVALMQAPGDNSRWFVVQQGGLVKTFSNVASPTSSTNFINLSSRITFSGGGDERGLLGMAFHPNFPTDPRVFIYYTSTDATLGAVDRLSEFRTTDGGATLDATTEVELFDVDDPESNHNGGNVMFGPDGFLYIGIGDGGGGNDQHGTIGNSQRLTILLGKMLRIDVSTAGTYTIPPSNPYPGGARCNVSGTSTSTNCPEIYAYGFRNPWRWSFDSNNGDLWVGDVGESAWEEIDRVTLGGNYGWRCREGNHSTGMACGPNPSPINPIAEIAHPDANALTGGYVYRGSAIPGLVGTYFFGDYGSGFLWNIPTTTTPTRQLTTADGLGTPAQISSFGEDQAHELYFLDFSNGWVYKIVPGAGGGGGNVASLLSQTGCASSSNPKLPASGMIPYAPNAAFWSDGAIKSRWLALPNGQQITVDGTSNDFDLPNGSVLRKDFTIGAVLAETRLFMRHTDGNWAGYTYQWNAQGTDATRVIGGLTTTINGQTWEFPSESACLECHTAAAGRTLGLEIGQLNGAITYPATGRTANQVFTLNFINTVTPAVVLPVDQLPVIPNPIGTAGTEGERARAWLHTNCSNCHRPGGTTPVNLDFRYTTTLLGTNSCDMPPTLTDLGIANARLIAPGDAARSVVLARVNRVGTDAMPPLARHSIDTAGVTLLTSWINSLANCN